MSDTTDDLDLVGEPASGAPTQASLVLAHAEGGRRAIERSTLPSGGVLLGRGALLFGGGLLDDSKLSRRHAELQRDGDRWLARDLGSRNGTFVNGQRLVQPHALQSGDVIRVGATLLVFALLDAEPGDEAI